MIEIQTRIEGRRGCGFRKPGGIYLVGPPTGQPCCKLPFPLTICPCCGAGIKPSRGWTWVDCKELFEPGPSCNKLPGHETVDPFCPLSFPQALGMAGLLWIGEAFYKTPEEFLAEARAMGISRRISTVPKGFEPGKTWVLLAHRKGIKNPLDPTDVDEIGNPKDQGWIPAIFSVFRPQAIEYVVKGDETQDELERIVKRGLTPVKVNPPRAYRD